MPPSKQKPEPGQQWTERRLLDGLKRAIKPLGLKGKLHTYRHAFISGALLAGTPVAVVREWIGHVDARIIDLYTHVHNDASQAAMLRLAKAKKPPTEKQQESSKKDGTGSAQSQHTKEDEQDGRDAN